MICPYCQVRLEDDATFCHWCGGKIDPEEVRKKEAEKLGESKYQKYVTLNRYYRQIFLIFDANGGGFILSWNWSAFLFGTIWYFLKGMWAKGLLMILLTILFGGGIAPFLWFYSGLCGNWDYYLFKVKRTQFWA